MMNLSTRKGGRRWDSWSVRLFVKDFEHDEIQEERELRTGDRASSCSAQSEKVGAKSKSSSAKPEIDFNKSTNYLLNKDNSHIFFPL